MNPTTILEFPYVFDEITYDILTKEDEQEALICLTNSFYKNDPIVTALKIPYDSWKYLLQIYMPIFCSNGLCLIAKKNNKIVGVYTGTDYSDNDPDDIDKIDPIFIPVFNMLDKLDNLFKQKHSINGKFNIKNQIYHPCWSGIDPNFTRNKIGSNLFMIAIQMLMNKGFEIVKCEASGNYSSTILKKLGMYEVYNYYYSSDENLKIISDSTQHDKCSLLEIYIN